PSPSLLRPSPSPTLFPYTTLFRSTVNRADYLRPQRLTRRCSLLTRRTSRPTRAAVPTSPPPATSMATATPMPSSAFASPGLSERSEEHTSELQSLAYLVCRLLLEK